MKARKDYSQRNIFRDTFPLMYVKKEEKRILARLIIRSLLFRSAPSSPSSGAQKNRLGGYRRVTTTRGWVGGQKIQGR